MKKIILVFLMLAVLTAGCARREKEPAQLDVTLYFGSPDAIESGEPGEYGFVTPVSRQISHTEEVLKATLEELIAGPSPEDGNVTPVVHSSLKILDVKIEDKAAFINVSKEMFGEEWAGGTLGGTVFVQAFTWTAAQFTEVDKVQVLVEGELWDDGHMIWDEPIAPPQQKVSEIEEWVEYSRDLFLAQAREDGGKLYLLATYGEKMTGGYSVEITEIVEADDKITVTVKYSKPGEDDIVTQAITYPYDLKEVEAKGLPVEFAAEGAESYVPTLIGIDWLRPPVAGTGGIKIFAPAPQSAVARKFSLEGVANVFEGTVLYRLLDSAGKKLDSGITTGAMGDWGYFKEKLVIPQEIKKGNEFLLELYTESAKDGSKENQIEIELTLK